MLAMNVEDIGEFRLIDTLAQAIAEENGNLIGRLDERGFRVRLSIGDDAAAWDAPPGVRVLTTDTMVEGVHFNLGQISWRDLGWKSLAVNLSDVAAMGCAPLYSVVTLGLRGDLPVDGLLEMYQGMLDAHRLCGGAIVGGDIVSTPVFFVTVALEGAAVASNPSTKGDALLTRSSAMPGDKIAVTGHLGCSGGGLRILLGSESRSQTFDDETSSHLINAHTRPMPRVAQGITLAKQGVVTAMDISDGLVDDLGKMCNVSGVGAVIRADLVPADGFLKKAYPDDWLSLALGGGEDYELLFTAPQEVMDKIAFPFTEGLDVPISIIGDIVEGPSEVKVLDRDGNALPVERGGWDHFRRT